MNPKRKHPMKVLETTMKKHDTVLRRLSNGNKMNNEQGCPECNIETAEYLGNEDDGTPIYRCKSCGTVFEGEKSSR